VGRRVNTHALLKKIKKRLNKARQSLKVGDELTALEQIDYALIELDEAVEE